MADGLADQLGNTKLGFVGLKSYSVSVELTLPRDDTTNNDWKKELKIPSKDTRTQTEVYQALANYSILKLKCQRMSQLQKASSSRTFTSNESL